MPLEGVQLKKMKLSHARAELQLTQTQLASMSGVSRTVIYYAEAGEMISKLSAYGMLNALNRVRAQQNLPLLAFEQLDWKVQGE